MITYQIKLYPERSTFDPIVLYLGDTGACTMEISIYEDDDQPKNLTDYLTSVTVKHSDGHVREKLLVKKEDASNVVLWHLIKEDLSVPGRVTATIHLYGTDDSKQSYPDFEYMVEAASYTPEILRASTDFDLYVNARHCGSYNNTTRYFINNIVEYAGASYMALRDTLGNPPPVSGWNNSYWHKMTDPGEIDWRGEYQEETGYGVGAVVGYDGSSWICVQPPAEEFSEFPSETSDQWNLMARRGMVQTVNGVSPDDQGNVLIHLLQTVNGVSPDSEGNAVITLDHMATPHIDYAPPPDCFMATLTVAGWSHGKSVSGADPATDISGGPDNKLQISIDGDTPEEITLVMENCDSSESIASELQTQIQALGGNKESVTVQYVDGLFVITSSTNSAESSVVITDGTSSNVADDLKLGVANGGTETGGGEQTISDTKIYSADAYGDIMIAQSASNIEFEAWVYAMIRVVNQSMGSITVRAIGDIPTIDIPLAVEVR